MSARAMTTEGKLNFKLKKKVPLVMQAEASECGIACLAMIANFHGNPIDLREFRQAMPASSEGAKLSELITYAQHLGLSSRAVKADLKDISNLITPCILHWEFSHYVVLTRANKRTITILDPALGKRTLSTNEFSQGFTGICLELTQNKSLKTRRSSPKFSLAKLITPIKGIKRQLSLIFAVSLLIQVFSLISPLYMQTVIDKVLIDSNDNIVLILALGFGLVLLLDTMCSFLRESIVLRFSNELNLHLSKSVLSHMLRLPTDYFQRRHMGDILSRFSSLQAIRDVISQSVVSAIVDGLLAITTLIVMFAYSVKLALVTIVFAFIYSILRWWLFYPVKRLNHEILHSSAKQQSFLMQSLRAIRTIKLSNSEAKTESKWLNYFVDNANQRIKLGQWNIGFSTCNKALFGLENILIVYFAAHLVMDNSFTVGMLIAFVSFKNQFLSAHAAFLEKWIEYKVLDVHLHRLDDVINHPTEASAFNHSQGTTNDIDHNAEERLASNPLAKAQNNRVSSFYDTNEKDISIEIKNLSFKYHPHQQFVFSDVNLRINTESFIAIVGASGCGKSSFLNCLLGLTAPHTGQVLFNEQLLTPQTRNMFNIAAVLQSDSLLTGSVLDNICNFAEHIDVEKALEAAQLACIHNDIMAMTMQYQTLIGDMGDSLSGGQKQRILLARAFYQKPQLLILDEATSHLDLETEKQVCNHLQHLNSAIVMVAHRPQTISTANQIFSLSSKGLTELKTNDDVLSLS